MTLLLPVPLVALSGLFMPAQQEAGIEVTIPAAVLERVYDKHHPVSGWVEQAENRYVPRIVSESALDPVRARLFLIARFRVDEKSRIQEYSAAGRVLDVLILNESHRLLAVGLDIFEFDGHSRIGLEPQLEGELEGIPVVGIVDDHNRNGVEVRTLYLVRLSPRIQTVFTTRTLFSECGATADAAIRPQLRNERGSLLRSDADPYRLILQESTLTCSGEEIESSKKGYVWDPDLQQFIPED